MINNAEYCQSMIADGEELITGNESGKLVVPELNDGNVFIIFKDDVTSFKNAFETCDSLTTIPDNLFADNPSVTSFQLAFDYCIGLTTIPDNLFANNPKVVNFNGTFLNCGVLKIPENLFANCPKVTDFSYTFHISSKLTNVPNNLFDSNTEVTNFEGTFSGCNSLTGESPYTMIGDKKVHLYERKNYPEHFTTPIKHDTCFSYCAKLSDYAQIPSDWK